MKTRAAALMASIMVATVAGADSYYQDGDNAFYARGRVLSAEAVYETVRVNNPEQRCWNERVRRSAPTQTHNKSYTPMIAGAIVGGAIGNQFGKGSGKDAMTVAGALLGGSIGNDFNNRGTRSRSYVTNERRCEMVDHFSERRELAGYNVKYSYDGKTFWTHTDQHPGRYIDLQVTVAPSGRSGYNFSDYD